MDFSARVHCPCLYKYKFMKINRIITVQRHLFKSTPVSHSAKKLPLIECWHFDLKNWSRGAGCVCVFLFFFGGGRGERLYMTFWVSWANKWVSLNFWIKIPVGFIMSPLTRSGGRTYCFWRQRKTSCPLCNLNIFGIFWWYLVEMYM